MLMSPLQSACELAMPHRGAPMTPPPRLTCSLCRRPQSTCICRFAAPTPTHCEVLILQHPLEVQHVKNSARLLHLSLTGSRLVVGEVFDDATLRALLPAPRSTVLLYPATAYTGHAPAAPLDAEQLTEPKNLRLVVLDATWRKSRKMLHRRARPTANCTFALPISGALHRCKSFVWQSHTARFAPCIASRT